MDDDLFNDNDINYLDQLVGDGKKFRSVEELAKGKAESDEFILRLQNENAQMREAVAKGATLDQVLAKLEAQMESRESNSNTSSNHSSSNYEDDPFSDIDELLEKKLNDYESRRVAEDNLTQVRNKLKEIYGPEYGKALKAKGEELGLDESFLNNLAKEKPQAFLALVGTNRGGQHQSSFSPPVSSHTSPNAFSSNTNRNYKYYENLRRQNSAEYWTPRVQNQMHNDAIRLGENFFSD